MATNIYREFKSVAEFNAALEAGKTQDAFLYAENSRIESAERTEFTGTKSYGDATSLLMYGDKSLRERLERAGVAQTRARLMASAPRRQVYSSVVGCAPNVPNYVAGTPNSMLAVRCVTQKTKVLNVMYNTAAACNITADEILHTAANFASALLMIERGGTRTNVYTSWCACNSNNETFAFSIKVKSSGQHFDTLRMAYPIMHASFLRRHGFRLVEITEGLSSSWVYGYGRPIKNSKDARKAMKLGEKDKHTVVVSYYEICNMRPQQIAELIRSRVQ